jgi:hypothetical protein
MAGIIFGVALTNAWIQYRESIYLMPCAFVVSVVFCCLVTLEDRLERSEKADWIKTSERALDHIQVLLQQVPVAASLSPATLSSPSQRRSERLASKIEKKTSA